MKATINRVPVNAHITNYLVTVKNLIVTVIKNDDTFIIYNDDNARHLNNSAKESIVNAVKRLSS